MDVRNNVLASLNHVCLISSPCLSFQLDCSAVVSKFSDLPISQRTLQGIVFYILTWKKRQSLTIMSPCKNAF